MRKFFVCLLLVFSGLLSVAGPAEAQYFGRNKVQYKKLDFSILKTAHFKIYFYPEEAAAARDVAGLAERWYDRLSAFFGHTLSSDQPLILYASHPDFEQTNVIDGLIDEGTGGVTEGLRRRIILPLAASRQETDHVLGHELVHAFQYDMLDLRVAGSLPLWYIEGMAEYLSLGSRSSQTAMWLRDAVIEEHFPKIKDLDNPKYFPYRFGHGLWAYLGARFGDEIITRTMEEVSGGENAADAEAAIEAVTGIKSEQLSADWREAVAALNRASSNVRTANLTSTATFSKAVGGGRINVGPALSPDGKLIAFMSERDGLSLDLFLADAVSGTIIRKLLSTATDPHFDSLQFLNSAGSFSPDGSRLALATVRKGYPSVAIIRIADGSIEREYAQTSLGEIFQPTWSPDARSIAFSAQAKGVTDLFVMSVADGTLRQLTNDAFADLHPVWSPDNSAIAFVSDRFSAQGDGARRYELASVSPSGGQPVKIDVGLTGHTVNPQWTDEGRTLLFISDHDGRPNLYAASGGASARQLTSVATGVAGFTPLTPALAAAANASVVAVSLFKDGGFDIHVIETPAALPSATAQAVNERGALVPTGTGGQGTVDRLLVASSTTEASASAAVESYSPKLSLVAAGNQLGVTAGGRFGSYASGGIGFYFSDALNEHQLATSVSLNGGLKDVAASAQYVNRTRRWNWGVFASQDPYLTGNVTAEIAGEEYREETLRLRQTSTTLGGLVAYPFSRASRLEITGGLTRIGFSNELETRSFSLITGDLLDRKTEDLGASTSLKLVTGSAALVRDTSVFGLTGPLLGQRARLEVGPVFGDLNFTTATADLRQYVMPVRPVTLAARVLHLGRYGREAEDPRMTPYFLGDPEFVRGYDFNSFEASDCTPTAVSGCPEFDRLVGSRVLVLNGEVRAPLAGLFTGRLSYGYLPIDIFGFFDAGVAWTSDFGPSFSGGNREFVSSAGAGLRANVFGYAVVELNLARPLNRSGRGWIFGFNLRPGF